MKCFLFLCLLFQINKNSKVIRASSSSVVFFFFISKFSFYFKNIQIKSKVNLHVTEYKNTESRRENTESRQKN